MIKHHVADHENTQPGDFLEQQVGLGG